MSRYLPNQSGNALCYVSPARCASSSFTSAKRIARLIRWGRCRAGRGRSWAAEVR